MRTIRVRKSLFCSVCLGEGQYRIAKARGYCHKHHMRWLRHGDPLTDLRQQHGYAAGVKQAPTYISWLAMKVRCTNPNHEKYPIYGGRGITVCDRWMNSFVNFLEDMGERPEGMTLDRIDPDGNYEPSNCRWATPKEQIANRRTRGSRHMASRQTAMRTIRVRKSLLCSLCLAEGEYRIVKARGLCAMHYWRWRTHGDPLVVHQHQTKLCSIEDCALVAYARGWCRKHYTRWWNHGDVHTVLPRNGVVRHGYSRRGSATPTYRSWHSMKTRCTNANHDRYHDYGGRGIAVCDRWMDSFENFLADMGERPEGKTLDRIDNNGNYEPGNVRWATPKEQAANRRPRSSNQKRKGKKVRIVRRKQTLKPRT